MRQMISTRWLMAASILAMAAAAPPARAQSATTGNITGLVRDGSGAVVPNAGIVARNEATNVEYRAETSGTGNYAILNLPIGSYEVTVSTSGFKSWSRAKIPVASSETVRVDVTMQVGEVIERVQVVARAPALQTESAQVSSSIERRQVEDLPVAVGAIGGMRTALSLMIMLPEVRSDKGEGSGNTPSMRIGGGQSLGWSISVDGQRVETGWRNIATEQNQFAPPIEAVEEFRVDSGSFKASDHQSSGGMVTMVTKSGTNEFHGSVFDFYQSQNFNANSWLNNKLGRAKPVFHRHDFGFTAGGPVIVPKIYNGRNKSHFFVAYEGYRFPQTTSVTQSTVPTTAMRGGDFRGWVDQGQLIPIYDPGSTRRGPAGEYIRDPFPANVIPGDRISPISKKIAAYYPDPNAPGLLNNYLGPASAFTRDVVNTWTTRGDQSIGARNRLGVTFTRRRSKSATSWDEDPLNPRSWPGLPYPLGSQSKAGIPGLGDLVRANDSHVLAPNMINTLTFGFHRHALVREDVSVGRERWGEVLGGLKNAHDANAHFPTLEFATDNYTGASTHFIVDRGTRVYGLDDSVSWIRGNHNLQFGYSLNVMLYAEDIDSYVAGTNSFHRLETARPADNSGRSGNSFASFLLGAVHSGGVNTPSISLLRYPYHAFFVQDDWKITTRLTANLGFRMEVNRPVTEAEDRASYFDPALPNPAADGFLGALRFLGQGPGREGRRTFFDASKGWGPRAGLAYQLTPQTVVRAGFGLYYAPNKFRLSGLGFDTAPRWTSVNQGVDPAYYWDGGYPGWQRPPFIDPGYTTGLGVSWPHADNLSTAPTNAAFNFSISRTVPGNLVLDLTYSGNKGTRLSTNRLNYAQVAPEYAYLGSLLNRPIDDPAVARLGFAAPFPSFKALMGSRATLAQALRMFPQYSGVGNSEMSDLTGNSTYHSFLVRLNKRYSNGLSLLFSYVWSKMLTDADATAPGVANNFGSQIGGGPAQNHYDRSSEKSYSVVDMPHLVKATFSYDLPLGKGRPWLNRGPSAAILGGWNVAGFLVAQSGYPLGVLDSGFANYLFGGPARPNILSHDLRAPVAGERFDPDRDLVLNAGAFARRTDPSRDPFGNAPRFVGRTRWAGVTRENVTVQKRFYIFRERLAASLRWEIYDLLNHKTWNNPQSLDLANRQFGVVTGAFGNRTMQFGAKLQW
jgi:hypothetical protein